MGNIRDILGMHLLWADIPVTPPPLGTATMSILSPLFGASLGPPFWHSGWNAMGFVCLFLSSKQPPIQI